MKKLIAVFALLFLSCTEKKPNTEEKPLNFLFLKPFIGDWVVYDFELTSGIGTRTTKEAKEALGRTVRVSLTNIWVGKTQYPLNSKAKLETFVLKFAESKNDYSFPDKLWAKDDFVFPTNLGIVGKECNFLLPFFIKEPKRFWFFQPEIFFYGDGGDYFFLKRKKE